MEEAHLVVVARRVAHARVGQQQSLGVLAAPTRERRGVRRGRHRKAGRRLSRRLFTGEELARTRACWKRAGDYSLAGVEIFMHTRTRRESAAARVRRGFEPSLGALGVAEAKEVANLVDGGRPVNKGVYVKGVKQGSV